MILVTIDGANRCRQAAILMQIRRRSRSDVQAAERSDVRSVRRGDRTSEGEVVKALERIVATPLRAPDVWCDVRRRGSTNVRGPQTIDREFTIYFFAGV